MKFSPINYAQLHEHDREIINFEPQSNFVIFFIGKKPFILRKNAAWS
jgi:hypothetical protein